MSLLFRICLLSLCVFTFQNCGEFQAAETGVPYPFQTKPDFFYDVKVVRMEKDELGREAYEFDVAVSFASNPNQGVNYRVAFSTLDRSGVCRSEDWTAIGNDKHHRFTCIMPTPDDLYIQLTLLGPEGQQVIEQYRF